MRRVPIGTRFPLSRLDEIARRTLLDPAASRAGAGAHRLRITLLSFSVVQMGSRVMANAMLNIRVVQPRMMSIKQAADYVGLPLKRFPRVCSVRPIAMPESEERYDIRDLDLWLDHIKAGNPGTDAEILERLG